MADITSKVIDLWLAELIALPTAKNPGRRSFAKEVELLSNVFHWYRENKNEAFVVPITRRHREKSRYKDVPSRRPDYFIRPEEVRTWIEWLKEHRKPNYWRLATFLVLTGCRVGEACGLRWDAIDFQMKIARVVRTVYWDHHTKQPVLTDTTKTQGSNRIIVLPDELISMLQEMKRQGGESEWLFPGKNGNTIKYNAIQSAFNAGFVALELPWRSTHICRHTFATISLMATDSLSGVQASLGHTKQSMTEKYAKIVSMLNTGNAEKTASLFDLNRNHSRITHVEFRNKKSPRISGA
jgi:integrase